MTKGKECHMQRMKMPAHWDGEWWAEWPARLIWTVWHREKRNINRERGWNNGYTHAWLGSFKRVCPERAGSSVITTISITVICSLRKRQTGSSPPPHTFTCQRKTRQSCQEALPPWSTEKRMLFLYHKAGKINMQSGYLAKSKLKQSRKG